ncbi:GNAT family N-acetyltransferase [Glycomyces paridis]|uniref:Lysine N-acyltransferase MbtK n=1 Tax=Glycomyces paridis TaxID=2126555 RepID=A0A4S8NWK0_9ACTN|nr:GNAT family N-acetyltransferase [Glycomyces paridis]THV21241.1 GNAT family N-acetyltransferase [Glycomyces paridis]
MDFICYRDAWGIPHLRASDADALAYAQGWNAATDRAWQLENLRRRAHGTASALIGERWLHWDRLVRQARIESAAKAAFAALDPATAEWVGAYVRGVNAAMPTGAERAPELDALPEPWDPWTPLAVWHAEHLLFGGGFGAKLWRRRVAEACGEEAVDHFAMEGPEPVGSNGWLLDGAVTASGRPLLAGDPHRFLQLPGCYQQIHLACDEFDVVGLAMPGIPGIAHFGHAGTVAWGITNAMADTQDAYEERLRRNEDGTIEAFGTEGWEPAETWTETIEVAGGAPVVVEAVATARGPVVVEDARGALSLRSPLQADPDLGFAALPRLLRARTVADVDAAFDAWALPVNVVMAADTDGGLLHRTAGRVPDRDKANLRVPVPAWETRHRWDGWKPMHRSEVDRIAVMANDRGLSAPLGVEFCPPHRADRIRALLDARSDWTAEDMAAIHTDTLALTAGVLLDLLPGLDLGPEAAALRDELLAWNRRMDADSFAAQGFATFRSAIVRHLAALPQFDRLREAADAPPVFAPSLALAPRIAFALPHVLDYVAAPDRDRAIRDALEEAAGAERLPWGEAHRLEPWQDLPFGEPWPESTGGYAGDADCVLAASGAPGVTERFSRGPAARWVWDLADRSQSRWIVPFGASGVPGPHHGDQHPLWRGGELVPVVTDWDAMEEEYRMSDRTAVFERKAPGFGTVTIAPLRPAEDLDLVYGWVTEERARFWGMTGHSREHVLAIYEYLDALETHHAFLVSRDDEPIALFQTYRPEADPVGECYEVEPGDIGAHLLVAAARDRARPGFTGALMGVLAEYLFEDPANLRIVVEPDTRNDQARARLRRTGFTLGSEIELPDKTARLAFLRREDAACL